MVDKVMIWFPGSNRWQFLSNLSSILFYMLIVFQFLIVFTAGKQTTDQGSFRPLNEASKPLRDKGIEIYVVGVGSDEEIDVNELIQIAGKKENVLTTDRFEDLVILAEDIAKVACGMKR